MFGGGSSESDWTLLRRPSPEERVREKLPVPIRASSTFSKHFEGPRAGYKDSVFELASSLTGCSSREPGLLPALPRLDTPERGQRGLEPSKNASLVRRHRWSLENTLEDGPCPARPLARPCPGTRGKTLLLSVFHHAHVSHVMLRPTDARRHDVREFVRINNNMMRDP